MNFKPVDQKFNINTHSIIKLQDTDAPIVGNFIEVTKSKMGSNIYHIRRDYDLVRIYGFKSLDEQMACVQPDQIIRITYKGSTTTSSGGIRHLALVEVFTGEDEQTTEATKISNISNSNSKNQIHIPYSIDYPEMPKTQSNPLERFGIKK